MLQLDDPLRKALEPRTVRALAARLDLHTVGDLLGHLPRRYEKGGELTDIASLKEGEHAFLQATVDKVSGRYARNNKRLFLTEFTVSDGRSKQTLKVTFFNKKWLDKKYPQGSIIVLDGIVKTFNGVRQLTEPEVTDADEDMLLTGGPIPIYPSSQGLRNTAIARAVRTVLDQVGEIDDPLPVALREREHLPALRQAYEWVHRPKIEKDAWRGQHRLRWDEALVLQVALAQRRAATAAMPAVARPLRSGGIREAFERQLPFTLTSGQQAVTTTLLDEIAQPHPMHRLLEGEVGSGKTVVALLAMLAVIDAGGQAALLAPTEVLATQHHRSLRELLGPLGRLGELDSADVADLATKVVLLTGSTSSAARRETLASIADGTAGIVVGTHALLEESVAFSDLGLVVVDEQHRFGVEQRDALRNRGSVPPHVLVMTATPIPRTVAMTVFGDLETSSLTELPKGRQPITTHVVPDSKPRWVQRMWALIADQVANGHQAFVVCPQIDEGQQGSAGAPGGTSRRRDSVDDGDGLVEIFADEEGEAEQSTRRPIASVVGTLPRLREVLPGLRIEALHGRLSADEKDAIMTAFSRGEIDVLVSTTVVEVGVDVPNATVMAILDADRFGISQLHQLRGRVGRGSAAAFCLLHTQSAPGSGGMQRLEAVAKTQDGAELARADLDARREGDVLGAAQSGGRRRLRLLQLRRDEKLILAARAEATAIVERDPELTNHPALARALAAELDEDSAAFLEKG